MALQCAFRRKDIFAQALGLLDMEGRLGLAKFFESPIDSFELGSGLMVTLAGGPFSFFLAKKVKPPRAPVAMATITAPIEPRSAKLVGSFRNWQTVPSMARAPVLKRHHCYLLSAGRKGIALRAR
jgi:hypothetical protein